MLLYVCNAVSTASEPASAVLDRQRVNAGFPFRADPRWVEHLSFKSPLHQCIIARQCHEGGAFSTMVAKTDFFPFSVSIFFLTGKEGDV